MESFNLEAYRGQWSKEVPLVQPSTPPPPPPTPIAKQKTKSKGWFLKGPIPGDWLRRAGELSGKALHVGLAVWHGTALEYSDKTKLTSRLLAKFGVGRHAGRRGLKKLEQAGLVTVERRTGCCPVVTLVTSQQSKD